ncbi:hypothetical protein BK784_39010 [Bacillus thuringiensis serovar medellin]|uniref:Uncharacterized protein n=2 Tax=Bacillus TaxID=1386 RepID=A0A9X6R7L0_BACTV|nr:hypothetical protein BK784_39010 [Bacillus thuringiensis serovar medellin]RGP57684.1 hypothetical protein BTW32_04585 [Bacillus thuringiensis]HDR8495042.1 hypothetical protein [Bacillus cereus]HDR8507621.1 hypothetical protein [Bacillus cereus]HDR8532799.1 hypothetical protein [Bacillus cereus]
MMDINGVIEKVNTSSKNLKLKMEKPNNLYHIPTVICLVWGLVYILNFFKGNQILNIGGSMPLSFVLFSTKIVGTVTFIYTITLTITGFVYSVTKEIPLNEYLLEAISGIVFICVLVFGDKGYELAIYLLSLYGR